MQNRPGEAISVEAPAIVTSGPDGVSEILLDLVDELVAQTDADGTIRSSNAAFERILGHPPESLLGRSFLEIVAESDHQDLVEILREVVSQPDGQAVLDVRLLANTGHARIVELRLTNRLDDGWADALVVTGRDVTTLRRNRHLLDKLRELLFAIPLPLAVLDQHGTVLQTNEAWHNTLGADHRRRPFANFDDLLHPDDGLAVARLFEYQVPAPVAVRMRRADGSTFPVRVQLTPFHDYDGEVLVAVVLEPLAELPDEEDPTAELTIRATHDALTGLANRELLAQRLRSAMEVVARRGTLMAVMFCDLDGFKAVNDSLGHQAGDAVLSTIAQRIRECVRPGDVVSRLGGDEFVVLAPNIADSSAAVAVAERLLSAADTPIDVGGAPRRIGMSVGIALSDRYDSPEQIIARADAAMYEAKRRGGSRYHIAG